MHSAGRVRRKALAHAHSTYARHRIRHGVRHTGALAGRRPCPPVANGRLRHMLIGDARVSKTDGSQPRPEQHGAVPHIDSGIFPRCPSIV